MTRPRVSVSQDAIERAYTPEELAGLWGCSANHVRTLIHRGELRAFRLGRRLLRIPPSAIGEYERCQMTNTDSDGSKEGASSHGGKTESGTDVVLMLPRNKKRGGKQST